MRLHWPVQERICLYITRGHLDGPTEASFQFEAEQSSIFVVFGPGPKLTIGLTVLLEQRLRFQFVDPCGLCNSVCTHTVIGAQNHRLTAVTDAFVRIFGCPGWYEGQASLIDPEDDYSGDLDCR